MASYPLTPERRPGESNEMWARRLDIPAGDEFWEDYEYISQYITDLESEIIPGINDDITRLGRDIDTWYDSIVQRLEDLELRVDALEHPNP